MALRYPFLAILATLVHTSACLAGGPSKKEMLKLAQDAYGVKVVPGSLQFHMTQNKGPQKCKEHDSFTTKQNVTYDSEFVRLLHLPPDDAALAACLVENGLLAKQKVRKKVYRCTKDEADRIWQLQYNDPNDELQLGPNRDSVKALQRVRELIAQIGDKVFDSTPWSEGELLAKTPELDALLHQPGDGYRQQFVIARVSVGPLVSSGPAAKGLYRATFKLNVEPTPLGKCIPIAPGGAPPSEFGFIFAKQHGKWLATPMPGQ